MLANTIAILGTYRAQRHAASIKQLFQSTGWKGDVILGPSTHPTVRATPDIRGVRKAGPRTLLSSPLV